ncbi:MAG: ABC transporter ATP-binding protein/permease [Clostridiales bacterium]|nr:ABC transporter ATP-binding protein/permease [Clostridiales bacterium]
MKKLFKYLKPYMLPTLLAPLFMLLEVAMDLMQPALMSRVIDVGVANADKAYIVRTCILMFVCALLGVTGGLGNMYFSTRAGYGFARDLRSDLYRRIQSFSFSDIDRFKTGSLVTRTTNDVTQIQNAFTTCIRMLVRAPFLCIGGVVMVLVLNAKLSLVVLAAIPFLTAMIMFLLKRGRPLFTSMQEKLDRVNTVMQENLSGIRVVKAFARADHEKAKFKVANDDLCDSTMRAMMMMSMAFPLINLIMNATMILMYAFGGSMVFHGELTPGEIMAFSNYIMQILMSLTMSSFMLMFLSRAGVSIRRVLEVLNTQSDIVDGSDADAAVTRGEVAFDHVSFAYPGQSGNVLSDITFTARAGETVAILGSTGSGKSTLISLIPRLYDASAGSVKIDGRDVRAYHLNTLRGAIGVALQESVLFTGTIEENLRWGDENASPEEIRHVAAIAQADPFVEKLADGYQTELGQRGVNLSGGQKQRLCIARALAKRPRILILDDSTSAVDLATEAEIQKGLRGAFGDMTVFIIAQRISSVMDADRILVMENGRVIDSGKHEELKKRCEVYREIVVSQLGEEAARA